MNENNICFITIFQITNVPNINFKINQRMIFFSEHTSKTCEYFYIETCLAIFKKVSKMICNVVLKINMIDVLC